MMSCQCTGRVMVPVLYASKLTNKAGHFPDDVTYIVMMSIYHYSVEVTKNLADSLLSFLSILCSSYKILLQINVFAYRFGGGQTAISYRNWYYSITIIVHLHIKTRFPVKDSYLVLCVLEAQILSALAANCVSCPYFLQKLQ